MSALGDKRTLVIGAGAVVAIGVGAALAYGLTRGPRSDAPPPAAEGGLKIEIGETERAQLDPTKPLRCYVKGQFVGDETLARCAARNGVAAQALDVGLDESGALVAEVQTAATDLDPVPAETVVATPDPIIVANGDLPDLGPLGPGPATRPAGGGQPSSSCLKHGSTGWSTVSDNASLGTCVSLLFDGRCEQPGNAQYGRWGEQTVRLVPGKIEIAADGRTFSTLAEQGPNCTLPPI